MKSKQSFTIQTLIIILLLTVILLGIIYAMAGETLQASGQLWTVLIAGFGTGLLSWAGVQFVGKQAIDSAVEYTVAQQPAAPAPMPAPVAPPPVIPEPVVPPPAAPVVPEPPSNDAAIQMLSILQREGRLIDFLHEDLSAHPDDLVGAAVRNIHQESKSALDKHLTLRSVLDEAEGSEITLEAGFDAQAIRLTGNVAGDPPFKGTIQHRGWCVDEIDLPERMQSQDGAMIVAPAEVEIG